MNITLALGLHFDNNSRSNLTLSQPEQGQILQRIASAGTVIDVEAEPESSRQFASGTGHRLLFAYNFRGQPEPIWTGDSTLNIYI